ncbi:MAG: hypothetical protein IPP29_06750 [Bacteroidetes bacterium]|nr:hypothetical protein [Bacteroidota bacterium]
MIAAGKEGTSASVGNGHNFKGDVEDLRNSKVSDVANEFILYGVKVDVIDPKANSAEVEHVIWLPNFAHAKGPYDANILAVAYKEYALLTEDYFLSIAAQGCVLVDLKGIMRNKIKNLNY